MNQSFKNDYLSPLMDLSQYESLGSSLMLTSYESKMLNHSPSKKRYNQSFTKSNRSSRSKYTNSSQLTKSNLYEALRRGGREKNLRKEEELEIQLNLLSESLQILNK
jgi:hypothetical protein